MWSGFCLHSHPHVRPPQQCFRFWNTPSSFILKLFLSVHLLNALLPDFGFIDSVLFSNFSSHVISSMRPSLGTTSKLADGGFLSSISPYPSSFYFLPSTIKIWNCPFFCPFMYKLPIICLSQLECSKSEDLSILFAVVSPACRLEQYLTCCRHTINTSWRLTE